VQRAYNDRIYSIFQECWKEPFKRIRLPPAIYDVVTEQQQHRVDAYSPTPLPVERRNADEVKLDVLLYDLSPRLKERRMGAWGALLSENPDRLSQAANSMVEVLDKVIAAKVEGTTLQAFLETKYSAHQQTDWVERTRAWISSIKAGLHGTKHETNEQSQLLTERLLHSAESIMLVILE
jgi:hypothetical protein